MAVAHGLHLPQVHVGMATDRARTKPGEHVPAAGRILVVGYLVAAAAWLLALVEILNLPQSQVHSGTAALWTALAIGSAISIFLLGIWKVHRA